MPQRHAKFEPCAVDPVLETDERLHRRKRIIVVDVRFTIDLEQTQADLTVWVFVRFEWSLKYNLQVSSDANNRDLNRVSVRNFVNLTCSPILNLCVWPAHRPDLNRGFITEPVRFRLQLKREDRSSCPQTNYNLVLSRLVSNLFRRLPHHFLVDCVRACNLGLGHMIE